MRGIAKLPDMIASRLDKTRRSEAPEKDARAPKPASRSQTDAVGAAQYAMSLSRGRKPSHDRDRGLILPVQSLGQEDHLRQTFLGKGLFLVRQDQWEELGQLIRDTDVAREKTSEGIATATLLSQGAREDFVQAARGAFAGGKMPDNHVILALEEALEDCPECWGVAVVVAQAHMDIGLAALGNGHPSTRPALDNKVFRHHFARAAEILDAYCAVELGSPLMAEARCDLLLAAPDAPDRVSDDFEDLIDLDPDNSSHMRRFGLRLLPRWYGSFDRIDDRAHETAERVGDIWGEGGYTWVWFDVLRAVPNAAERLDIDRYLEGMADILDRRGTQHVVNLMAAHAAVAMDPTSASDDLSPTAARKRASINAAFDGIVRGHLRELHPRHWAEAQQSPFYPMPDIEALAEDGEALARTLISRHFREELSSGRTVTFSPRGLELQTPA
ncbi:hypothetical protein [Pseudooceanicola nanhaiensis]|uniref:hypothetical protein n=2 Tax=Pseudooceanicola nanhaiensis TaxID=375761 RepID=UPI00405973EB